MNEKTISKTLFMLVGLLAFVKDVQIEQKIVCLIEKSVNFMETMTEKKVLIDFGFFGTCSTI